MHAAFNADRHHSTTVLAAQLSAAESTILRKAQRQPQETVMHTSNNHAHKLHTSLMQESESRMLQFCQQVDVSEKKRHNRQLAVVRMAKQLSNRSC
jgi:hypothetical protein